MDVERRRFLKFALLGGAALAFGSILSACRSLLGSKKPVQPPASRKMENFDIVEDKDKLKIYNRRGEEILEIEK